MKKSKVRLFFITSVFILISMMKIITVSAQNSNIEYVAKTYIDYPTNTSVGGNVVVEGWIMTNDEDAIVKAYIDDVETQIISQTRVERIDVLNAIKGYGTIKENPKPGVKLILDTKEIWEGEHKLTLKVFSEENDLLTQDSRIFNFENEKARMYIDEPLNNGIIIKDEYKIKGWKMSNDVGAKIKVYVDDKEQNVENLIYKKRPDVIKAIEHYGTELENELPGFEFDLDVNKIEDGNHILKIQVLSEEGTILTQDTKQIIIQKYVGRTYIDYPFNNAMAGIMLVDGWVMTNDEQATIKIYIDDVEQNIINFKRTERKDVLEKVTGVGTEKETPLPGILCDIDINQLSEGEHKISLKVFSREQKIIVENTNKFYVQAHKATMYIDTTTKGTNVIEADTKIDGWIMSNDRNAKIKVYIDNEEQQIYNYTRLERTDVINAIKGYGTKTENPLPGFEFNIDFLNISNGEHTLRIDVLSNDGQKISSQERTIVLEKYHIKMDIDSPYINQTVKKILKLQGWVMSNTPNSDIKVYIDEKEIKDLNIARTKREDVIKAIKDYGTIIENPLPGFEAEIDVSKIKDGKHTIKIVAVINSEVTTCLKKIDFIINKYQSTMYLDEPSQIYNAEDMITIRGWAMSELANKKIIVKFDNNVIEEVALQERKDVLDAIKGFGTIEENPNPGFITNVNTQSYEKGKHTITIQIYSYETEEVISELKRDIILVNKIQRETITYGYSGAYLKGISDGSELKCYKYGNGPNVLFATFCVHGYEDSWDRDGEALVKIGNEFYDRLILEQDYSLASKWTVYVFPEVNPDGRRLGTTKNGPGRTTLYSKVGKGIDINRSWQTGSNYERFTSNRNYNGTEGFQAYEAEYLRDFMLTHKSTNGQNIVIDLHGWLDQLIGDESVCKYYKEQYPSCKTTGYGRYGSQYMISWARLNLGAKVALVELPVAQNMAEVYSMQLPEKYINATLNLMRGI